MLSLSLSQPHPDLLSIPVKNRTNGHGRHIAVADDRLTQLLDAVIVVQGAKR
jgi:hypothetical protein